MRHVITNYVKPAKSNGLWDQYLDLSIYNFTFLKNHSYEVVMEKFIPKFTEVMTLILEMKNYVDESLARFKILALPAPKQVLHQIEAKIYYAQIL